MYTEKKFDLPELHGISSKQVEIHLKLYAGYVKFTNTLLQTIAEMQKDAEKNAYALGEVNRRLGFEFDGMRMHELYFSQFERGPKAPGDTLSSVLANQYGSIETFTSVFKSVGLTRGIGWTVLYFDPSASLFHIAWVGDHEFGQLSNLPVIMNMDMWEHAYMVDYAPAEKAKYIDAFWQNLNWTVMGERLKSAQSLSV